MKLIESSAEYIPQEPGLDGIYKQIEKCGRVCYKSEGNITEDSAKSFVDRLITSNHLAMLEHGTVFLYIPQESNYSIFEKYKQNFYSYAFEALILKPRGDFVTTNLRVLQENNWLSDLEYFCAPMRFHRKRYTMKFTCSRAIANELVRHRVFSFAQESSRYCNYSKDKFNNEITFIEPYWISDTREFKNSEAYDNAYELFWSACEEAEGYYFILLDEDFKPEDARDMLLLDTKTELCMTGFASDWRNVFDQRLFGKTGKPHPDMVALMEKAKAEFERAGVWEDIMSYPSKFK